MRLVLEKVQREQTHIDLILATGDIAQDASEAAYTRFQQHLAQFDAPNYWLQGNHDITEPILNTLNDKTRLSPCVIQQDGWQTDDYQKLEPRVVVVGCFFSRCHP